MSLLKLFWVFFKIGILSFGGGLAAMSIIQDEVVIQRGWISLDEFINLITIAQMTPGPIGLNLSTFVGTKLAGVSGALVATLAFIAPSIIILSILSYMYYKYSSLGIMKTVLKFLRPVVVALIAYAGIAIFRLMIVGERFFINYVGLFIFISTIVLVKKVKLAPIKAMLLSGAVGVLIYKLVEILP